MSFNGHVLVGVLCVGKKEEDIKNCKESSQRGKFL
jgi:hypothetical protein